MTNGLPAQLARILLASLIATALPCHAEQPKLTTIKAGPFSVQAPRPWAKGAIVEKIPIQPLYTLERWNRINAGKAKNGELPTSRFDLKPSYSNRPQHWAIRFPKLALWPSEYDPKSAGENPLAPQILIHKADEWRKAFADGVHADIPEKRVIANLRRNLENQDASRSPGYLDAHLGSIVAKKALRFKGGHGFRVVAQWYIEPEFLQKGGLHYLFLGMSDDNSCQIIATFPIDFPGLPEDVDQATHLGFRRDNIGGRLNHDYYAKYERAAQKWLIETLPKSSPSLDELDAMISSLVVQKWE